MFLVLGKSAGERERRSKQACKAGITGGGGGLPRGASQPPSFKQGCCHKDKRKLYSKNETGKEEN